MKRKQVIALMLSGILATSGVSPVIAADIAPEEATTQNVVSEPTNAETEEKTTNPAPAEPSAGNTSAPPAENTAKPPAEGSPQEAAKSPQETAPPQAAPQTSPAAPSNTNPKVNDDVSSLVSAEALQNMANNLGIMADQVIAEYNSMSKEEKDQIQNIAGASINIEASVQRIKDDITLESLKGRIQNMTPEEANKELASFDESIVEQIDSLNSILWRTKEFVSNYLQYLQSGIAMSIKQLMDILVKDKQLYTEDYLTRAQAYYNEALNLKPGVDEIAKIIKFCNDVGEFYLEGKNHLNTSILDDGLAAANAFAAYLACAPDPAIADRVFNYGQGAVITYGEIANYVYKAAEDLKHEAASGTLGYSDLSDYASLRYGNLLAAYDDVSSAILSYVSDQVKDADSIGYEGDEKSAYNAALNAFNNAVAGRNYSALPGAADTLKNAAKTYVDAASDYAIIDARKQLDELKEKLDAIKADIEQHRDYYNATYPAEVLAAINDIENADLFTMNGQEILELISKVREVIDKKASSYSQKLSDMTTNASQITSASNEWWAFIPASLRGEAPYAEAIALTNALTDALVTSSTSAASTELYDLDKLTDAYDEFTTDFNQADGKIQNAAKAAAQYVHDNAEKIYNEEAGKEHTDSILRAFRTAIDNLNTSIGAWDFNETRTAAAEVKAAEQNLLNDTPVKEEEKKPIPVIKPEAAGKTTTAKKAVKKTTRAAKTSDQSNTTQAGLLGLLSLTSIAGILGLKRKR